MRLLVLVLGVLGPAWGGGGCDDGAGEGDWDWIVSRGATRCGSADAVAVAGDTLYVATDGDDASTGTSRATAFRTLARALCNVQAGQTVLISPGIYSESVLMGGFSGDASPIVIRADTSGGGAVVLDGGGTMTFGLCLVDSTGVRVEGITFQNYTDMGLFAVNVHDLEIRSNVFADNGRSAIMPDNGGEGYGVGVVDGWNVTIEGNEARGNGPDAAGRARDNLGTGIDTYNIHNSVIRGNHGHHNIGGAMLVEDSVDVLVEQNLLEDNDLHALTWDDGGLWVDGGHGITIQDNIFQNNLGPGLLLSDEGVQYPDGSYGYVVRRNTITGNEYAYYFFNYGVCPYPPIEAASFEANDTTGNTLGEIRCEAWSCGDHKPCD